MTYIQPWVIEWYRECAWRAAMLMNAVGSFLAKAQAEKGSV